VFVLCFSVVLFLGLEFHVCSGKPTVLVPILIPNVLSQGWSPRF